MEPLDAAIRVLEEERGELHWTKIQDLALRRGYLDPFTQPDVRRALVAALADGARRGRIIRVRTGVYRSAD